jgi:hypothetical protein
MLQQRSREPTTKLFQENLPLSFSYKEGYHIPMYLGISEFPKPK